MRTLIISLAFILSSASWAQTVDSVDGALFQVNEGGHLLKEGTSYYAIDSEGKKRGLLKVTSVMDDTAMGNIIKGVAQSGWRLVEYQKKIQPPPQDAQENVVPNPNATGAAASPAANSANNSSGDSRKASRSRPRRRRSDDEIERSSWAIEALLGPGTVTYTVTGTSGSASASGSASGSTFGYGLDLGFHLWIKDFDIFLPQLTYASLQLSQGGASASGSKYDIGAGVGYLITDYRLKISALYQFLSGLGFSGASSAGIGIGAGFKVIAEYYIGSNYGVTLAYESLSFAGGSFSAASSGFSFGTGLTLSSFTGGFSYGF